jgi:uncharacterized protein (TIGR03067 family)
MANRLSLALFLVACSAGAPAQVAEEKTELEGVWDRVVAVRHGDKLDVLKGTVTTIRGHKFELRVGNRRITVGAFSIDPKKTPKEIDVTYTEGPDTGKVIRAIYLIDGDKLQFRTPGTVEDERPTTFVTNEQSRGFFSAYTRQK